MDPLVIREPTAEEARSAAEISKMAFAKMRRIYRPTPAAVATKKSIDQSLEQLVALRDGKIVGTVQYRFVEDSVRVIDLAVHPDAQRQGIARKLFDVLEQIGRKKGANCLALYTVEQTGNVAIYEKLGFHTIRSEAAGLFESDIHEQITEAFMVRSFDTAKQ